MMLSQQSMQKHRTKICKLLLTKFSEKQLIITTHDNFWYEQITSFQRAHKIESEFLNLRIVNWSLDGGPVIKPYVPRWEMIQEKISDGDKSGGGNEGRKYLEWVLEKICSITEAPVPFKISGKYEIGDLLPSAKKRLSTMISDEGTKKEFENLFIELETSIVLGNILSHNNPLEGEVSISDVEDFCEKIHAIHEKIICSSCQRNLKYYRELKTIRCSNGKCKAPLEIQTK
jgi:LSD1 subclass zinc finger protein